MTYRGSPVTQLDGTVYANSNCVAATATELGDCSTLGYWRVSPAQIRKLSGDTSGGISYTDANKALNKGSSGEITLTVLYWAPQNSTTSTLDDLLNAPRITGIIISCAVTVTTPFRTGYYTGLHSVVVAAKRYATVKRADGTTYQQKQALVMDPGHTNASWVWWPWSLLVKAATAAAGAGKIHVMYTRDLAGVSRVAKEDGAIRSTTSIVNNVVGKIYLGRTYTVVDTVKGSTYTLNGRTMSGWNKLGTNKYTVAKIR